jgi:hypothetical protein
MVSLRAECPIAQLVPAKESKISLYWIPETLENEMYSILINRPGMNCSG